MHTSIFPSTSAYEVARLPICAQPAVGTNRQLAMKKLILHLKIFYFVFGFYVFLWVLWFLG
jgi:hypothetical protein